MSFEGSTTNPVYRQVITPGYFQTMGIPLVKGRGITEQDSEGSLPVVVVNESFVKRCCGKVDPIGRAIEIHWPDPNIPRHRSTIVGVVKDVRNQTLLNGVEPEAYYSYHQAPLDADKLIVRTSSDPLRMSHAVLETIRSVARERPIVAVQTMQARLAGSINLQRLQTRIVTLFATIALIMATVGLYGLVSYWVAQRVREFGIRMALGAKRADITRLVMRQTLCLAALGVGIGLCGAFALTRVVKSLLFQVGELDPATFVGVSALLGGVALLAGYLPAHRAGKTDPAVALRCE